MDRFKNTLLVILAFSTVALAIGQYNTAHVIAQAIESVKVVNKREEVVPVVQVSQWEYKTASCIGAQPDCYAGQFIAVGLQGWELVSLSRGPAGPGNNYTWDFVFKRPRL